jgi:vacuolar-type H+-ATPase subunit E/Vma4
LGNKSGVAAIADEVIGDVQKEAEAIISEAENQAKEILRVAKEKADQTFRQIVAESKEKAESEKRKIASITEVDLRNRLLQTKEALVGQAFEKTVNGLKDFVKTEQYPSYLLRQIEEIAEKMQQKILIVEVNLKDKTWLTPDLLKPAQKKLNVVFQISDQTQEYIGGAKLSSADGKIIYDGTLDNRLEELKPELRIEIAKQLFKGEV